MFKAKANNTNGWTEGQEISSDDPRFTADQPPEHWIERGIIEPMNSVGKVKSAAKAEIAKRDATIEKLKAELELAATEDKKQAGYIGQYKTQLAERDATIKVLEKAVAEEQSANADLVKKIAALEDKLTAPTK